MEYTSDTKIKSEHCRWESVSRPLRSAGGAWSSCVASTSKKRAEMKRRKFIAPIFVYAQPEFRLMAQVESRSDNSGFPRVECALERYEGAFARCIAEVAGTRLPMIFPASILLSRNMREGTRFIWSVRGALPQVSDIEEVAEVETFTPDAEMISALDEFVAERESGVWASLRG